MRRISELLIAFRKCWLTLFGTLNDIFVPPKTIVSLSQCRRLVALGTGVRQVNHSEALDSQQDWTRLLESG